MKALLSSLVLTVCLPHLNLLDLITQTATTYEVCHCEVSSAPILIPCDFNSFYWYYHISPYLLVVHQSGLVQCKCNFGTPMGRSDLKVMLRVIYIYYDLYAYEVMWKFLIIRSVYIGIYYESHLLLTVSTWSPT